MTTTTLSIIPAKEAETSQTTQYTASSVDAAQIYTFTATNTSGSAATISVNIVPPAGTVGDSNLIVKDQSIPAGKTFVIGALSGHVVSTGGAISTIASAAGVTIKASGVEFS